MHSFVLFFVFIPLFLLAVAAPTTTAPSSSGPSSSHSALAHSSPVSHLSSSTRKRPPTPTTTHFHPSIPEVPGTRPLPIIHTRSAPVPSPVHTRDPFAPSPKNNQSGQKPISIAFEVLGGLFASALILSFIRCCHNYRKTPRRDRIADILHRHHLQRELEELERNPRVLRRPSLPEPAPPYFPRPPSYENQAPSVPRGTYTSRRGGNFAPPADYSAVATDSPRSTPPMSQRIPLPSAAVNPRAHPDLPSG